MKKYFAFFYFILICNFGFSQTWKSLAPFNYSNIGRAAAFSINGKGYIFGGGYQTAAYSYDTLANIWSTINNYPAGTTDGVVACTLNGIAYSGTGVQSSNFTSNFFKYDPSTGNWSSLPDFPGAGRAFAVAFALDGKVYIGGGLSPGYVSNFDFYAYDPVANSWGPAIATCPASGAGCDAVAFVVGDKAYVGTGGKINSLQQSVPTKDFWEYDTISKVWSRVADLPGSERAEASAFATCDKGYVGLGYINTPRDTDAVDFWQYDPSKNKWRQIADLTGPRNGACSFAVGKTGYVCVGFTPGYGSYYHDLWSYTDIITPSFTTANSSSPNICAGQSVSFTDTSDYSPTNWQWSFPGGTPGSSTQQNPVIRYDTAGTYNVVLSAWNGCDSAGKIFLNYVSVGQSQVFAVNASPPSICSGQNSTLSATGNSTYTWAPAIALNNNTLGSIITVSPTVTTTYIVSSVGTCGSTDTLVLTVENTTIGGIVKAVRDTICQNTTGNLSLAGNSSSVIQWQSSTDSINFNNSINDTLVNYKTNPLTQSTWFRAVVGSGNCSAISDTLKLYVPPPLVASFYFAQKTPNELTFNSDSSSGKIRSYHWDFGDNTTSSDSNPTHTYAKDTTYYVCLTLYDGSNCSYTFCRYSSVTDAIPTISASGNWVVYPNPFNEQLVVSSKETNGNILSIKIYNVLGQLVFNKNAGNSANNSMSLDVSSLTRGMYFVLIRTSNADFVQKVVKQ